MKPIVVYFSQSGNTESLARRISEDLGCESCKIEAVNDYGSYVKALFKFTAEKITRAKSYYANILPDLSGYDMIILGFPLWASAPPPFVTEFIRNCGTEGKMIIPFSTSGSTSISTAVPKLRKELGNSKILYPFNFSRVSKDDYDSWMRVVRTIISEEE
ncbi:MAG: hypothetical protein IKY00_02730 [Clostridia bacterium]|nr:hypothetical protein [Clostridia bacterium]